MFKNIKISKIIIFFHFSFLILKNFTHHHKSFFKIHFHREKIIISFHHSPFTSVSSPSNYHVKEIRKQFIPLFEEHNEKVVLVLTGHTHLYERSYKEGINYLVSGPSGGIRSFGFRKNPYSVFKRPIRSTYTHASITNQILELKTYERKGNLIDSLIINL